MSDIYWPADVPPSDPDKFRIRVECPRCRGTGRRCTRCGGTGEITVEVHRDDVPEVVE